MSSLTLVERFLAMPCRDAYIANPIILKGSATFDEALAVVEGHNIRSAPVVDTEGQFLGLFGGRSTFKALLPVSVTMEGGLNNIDFFLGASAGIAKKLKKIGTHPILEYLDQKAEVGYPDMPIVEAMRLMIKQGSPLVIVDRETGVFKGIVSEQSIMTSIRHMQEIVDNRTEDLSQEDIELLKEFGVLDS